MLDPDLLESLAGFWRTVDARTNPGVDPAELDRFERDQGTVLPADLRSYYQAVNGMTPNGQDDLMIRFVPHDESQPGSFGGLTIAVHRLGGFRYVLRPEGPVWLCDADLNWEIAPSLADFLSVYLVAPGRLFPDRDPN